MEIKNLDGLDLPKKIEKSAPEKANPKKASQKVKDASSPEKSSAPNITEESVKIEISEEAKKLQSNDNEIEVARELLAKLPTVRAHVIYEALAKLKAGVYSSEQIIAEAAARLQDSGELNDLI